jgi:capsular exopolysaccharide synthesis family protein
MAFGGVTGVNELSNESGFVSRRGETVERQEAAPGLAAATAQSDKARSPSQIDITGLLAACYKWKWLIASAILAGAAIAIAITMVSTRIYRAAAMLEINTAPIEVMGKDRGVQRRLRNEEEFLHTQYGLLKSRSLAERVAKTLDLGNDPGFVSPGVPKGKRELAATFKLMGHLAVDPMRGSHLVRLTYKDPSADRATRIVNAFAKGFIAAAEERRFNASAYARSFLQDRLESTRQKLEASERKLVGYAQNAGILQLDHANGPGGARNDDGPTGPSGDSLSSQTLTALNGALSAAISDRIAAEQRYKQAVANPVAAEALQSAAVQQLQTERNKLQADYRERLSTFKPDFPDMKATRTRIAQIDTALAAQSSDAISSLRSAYLGARGRESELRGQVSALRAKVLKLRDRGIEYTILQRDVDTNRAIYDSLLQRYKEIGVVGDIGESDAEIVDAALPPGAPYEPRPLRNLLAGILAGLAVGLALAFGIEFVDDTIKSPDDVASKMKLPMLGLVPRMPKASSMLEELADPRSDIAEAYYSVMTALQFTSNRGYPRSILVTSSRPGEGKSSTSLALAQNFARMGVAALLIDADLRKPSFNADSAGDIGLSRLLVTADGVSTHIVKTKTSRLSLLPSGPLPPNPAELLTTNRIRAIIEEATAQFDVVVIDAPPVLGLADAPILSSICEATLMVIESGLVRRVIALQATQRLTAAAARIAGAVLTKYSVDAAGYGYGYGYRYGASDEPTEKLDIAP